MCVSLTTDDSALRREDAPEDDHRVALEDEPPRRIAPQPHDLLGRRQGREPVRVAGAGFVAAALAIGGIALARYGSAWLHAFGPLARNANHETRWALPHRLEQLGAPRGVAIAMFAAAFALVYAWLAREAWRGRARLGLATCALLLAAPYLVVWYVVWALPLAAAEDDEPAALLSLALCAYLLRQTIPL